MDFIWSFYLALYFCSIKSWIEVRQRTYGRKRSIWFARVLLRLIVRNWGTCQYILSVHALFEMYKIKHGIICHIYSYDYQI